MAKIVFRSSSESPKKIDPQSKAVIYRKKANKYKYLFYTSLILNLVLIILNKI